MKDENCAYCMRNELLDQFGIFVCELPASIRSREAARQ